MEGEGKQCSLGPLGSSAPACFLFGPEPLLPWQQELLGHWSEGLPPATLELSPRFLNRLSALWEPGLKVETGLPILRWGNWMLETWTAARTHGRAEFKRIFSLQYNLKFTRDQVHLQASAFPWLLMPLQTKTIRIEKAEKWHWGLQICFVHCFFSFFF
jgi:hypothetical protein